MAHFLTTTNKKLLMKKIFILFLAICFQEACLHAENYGREVAMCVVSTADELVEAVALSTDEYKYVNITLANDIDLSELTSCLCASMFDQFIGEIDGQGYTLRNFKYQDTSEDNVALFGFAGTYSICMPAIFRNITLEGFNVRGNNHVACLVGTARNCNFENIRIILDDELYSYDEYCGTVAGEAEDCVFKDIVTCGKGYVYADSSIGDASVGGICGYTTDCLLYRCVNQLPVYSKNEYTGGIVGHLKYSSINSCVNTAVVSSVGENSTSGNSHTETGGITGKATDSSIRNSIMTANVYSDDDGNCDIIGVNDDSNHLSGNYYVKSSVNTGSGSKVSATDLASGKLTMQLNDNQHTDMWHQICQQGFPNPVLNEGTVYANTLCNGDISYSNTYSSTASHEPDESKFGVCNICGNKLSDDIDNVGIDSAEDLCALSDAVSKGVTFGTVELNNDIDLKGHTWIPIGSETHPFMFKEFNGNDHTITNLNVESINIPTALFGVILRRLDATDMFITNLIIDQSCTISSTATATAGIVARVADGMECTLTFRNCANQAHVCGHTTAAGLLAEISSAQTQLTFDGCYNAGGITANTTASAITAAEASQLTIEHSWNCGNISSSATNVHFTNFKSGSDGVTFTGCWDNGAQTGISMYENNYEILNGELCYRLNDYTNGLTSDGVSKNGWYQQIGTDQFPVWTQTADNVVYSAIYHWCDDAETTIYGYSNTANETNYERHDYDDRGICTRIEGEYHGKQPALEDNEYKITLPGNLLWLAQSVAAGDEQHDCRLLNDIVLVKDLILDDNIRAIKTAERLPWSPIGTSVYPYNKTFYGDGHTVSGIYRNQDKEEENFGFFGYLGDAGHVESLGVTDSYIEGTEYAGAIASYVTDRNKGGNKPKITGCYATGIVETSFKGYCGGLIGYAAKGLKSETGSTFLHDCYSMCKIKRFVTAMSYAGGLVGYIESGDVSSSYYPTEYISNQTNTYGTAMPALAFQLGEVTNLLNEQQDTGNYLEKAYTWAQILGEQTSPTFGNDGVCYKRKVSSGWGTLILPFSIKSDDNVALYLPVRTADDQSLIVTPAETVEPNTPCFFRMLNDNDSIITIYDYDNDCHTPESTTVTNTIGDMQFLGSYATKTVTPSTGEYNNYFLAEDKIWRGDEDFTLPAFRAYLQIADGSQTESRSYTLDIIDKATGINDTKVNSRTALSDSSTAYNLAGQRITSKCPATIYISNGKKFVTQ